MTPAERLLHADIQTLRSAFKVIEDDPSEGLTAAEASRVLDCAGRLVSVLQQDVRTLSPEQIDVIRDIGAALGFAALRSLVRLAEHAVGGSQPKMH
jgi:hypothetical protein